MFSKLKISRILPWMKLTGFYANPPQQVIFQFGEESLKVRTGQFEEMIDTICKFFNDFFPDYYPYEKEIPKKQLAIFDLISRRQMFCSIFVSFCHVEQIPVNEALFHAFREILEVSPPQLDFVTAEPDRKSMKPILSTLKYVKSIKSLVISSQFPKLFQNLSQILVANQCFKSIAIYDESKFVYFDQFVAYLENTQVVSFNFVNCEFNAQRFQDLICCTRVSHISTLSFKRCSLKSEFIDTFLENSDQFKKLKSLAFTGDHKLFTNEQIDRFMEFCGHQRVATLVLVDLKLKINHILNPLHNLLSLTTLDLSNNQCFTLDYDIIDIPPMLTHLIFSNVQWSPSCLIKMFTLQLYNPGTTVDFSSAIMKPNDWKVFFDQLDQAKPPPAPFSRIYWRDNIIDSRLICFLSSISRIRLLSIDHCTYQNSQIHSIINSLVVLFQHGILSYFSMIGTKNNPNTSIIKEIIPFAQNSIRELDVSNNKIGNEGIEMLTRLVEQSDILQIIYFDGSKPNKPTPVIKLFKAMQLSKTLIKCNFPENDIHLLSAKFPAIKDTIKEEWKQVKQAVRENKSNRANHDNNSSSDVMDLATCERTRLPNSQIFNCINNDQVIEETWDIDIALPLYDGYLEWEEMSKKYSLENLTGVIVE